MQIWVDLKNKVLKSNILGKWLEDLNNIYAIS